VGSLMQLGECSAWGGLLNDIHVCGGQERRDRAGQFVNPPTVRMRRARERYTSMAGQGSWMLGGMPECTNAGNDDKRDVDAK
jgi:hypothetical protein